MFTINGMGDVHQGFAGMLLKPWGERSGARKRCCRSFEPRISSIATAQAHRLLAAGAARLGRRAADAVRHHHDARCPRARRRAGRCARSRRAKAACSSSRIPTFASRRRRSSFISTTTRRTVSASSMADIGGSLATLLGGNYVNLFDLYGRSYRVIPQVPRDFRLNESWLTRYQIRTSSGTLVPLVECRDDHEGRCSRTRSPISSSSIRRRCRRCPSRAAPSARRSNS